MAKHSALRWITNEAKILRRKDGNKKEWKKYVAQASAIYASKHKGKSPVGKKKVVARVKKINGKKTGFSKLGSAGISADHSIQRILMKSVLMSKGINVMPNISDSDLQNTYRKLTNRKVPNIARIRRMIKEGKTTEQILTRLK